MDPEGDVAPQPTEHPSDPEAVSAVTMLEVSPGADVGVDPSPEEPARDRWRWAAYLCLVPLVAVVIRQGAQLGRAAAPTADWAVLELNVRTALEGRQLLGPYSRFGFNHPGPAMFYLLAVPYALLGRSLGALTLATAAFNAVLGAVILRIARRTWGTAGLWAAAVTLAVFLWRFGPERLRDPWNPYLVVLPVTVVLLLVADLHRAPTRARLALFAALASLAVQSHLGSAVVVGPAAVFVAAGLIRYGQARGARVAWALAWPAALLTAVMWALPIVQVFTAWPGNLARIGNFLLKPHGDVHTLGEAAQPVVLALAMSPAEMGTRFGPASPFIDAPAVGPAALGALAVLVGLLAIAAGQAARHDRPHELAGCAAIACSTAGFLVSALRMRGELFLYLFMPMIGVALAAWVTAVSALARSVAERPFALPGRSGPVPARHGIAIAAVLALLAGGFTVAATRHVAEDGSLAGFSSPDGTQLAAALDPVCSGPAGDVTVSTLPDGPWDQAVTVGLVLARCGRRVGFTDGLAAVVGSAYPARPGGIHLAVGPPTAAATPGQTELARTGTSSLFKLPR